MTRAGAGLTAAAIGSLSFQLLGWPAKAAPANTLNELSAKIGDCLRPVAVPASSSFTVFFTLKRDGSLLGKPKITYSDLSGEAGDQKRFVEDALAAIQHCLPFEITDGLGGAVAGRPIALKIGQVRRATGL